MNQQQVRIAPSMLSADFGNLARSIAVVEKAGADWLHVDVMDGHFVPNLTIGPGVVTAVRGASKLFFDVHLMIDRPDQYWKVFADAGAQLINVHVEAPVNCRQVIRQIRAAGLQAGMAIRPKTALKDLLPYIPQLDLVLVMTVEPGFGGQQFMEPMLERIAAVRDYIARKNPACALQVDGGINTETAVRAVAAGADVLVAGNAIFGAPRPGKALKDLRRLIDNSIKNRYNNKLPKTPFMEVKGK